MSREEDAEDEWQRRGMKILWTRALSPRPNEQVGYYFIYKLPYTLDLRCFRFIVDDPDEPDPMGRVIGWTLSLSERDREYHPYRGVMRDLFALPLTLEPPESKHTKLLAGKLLWFLEQFELLGCVPSRRSLGLPDRLSSQESPHASSSPPPLPDHLPLDLLSRYRSGTR